MKPSLIIIIILLSLASFSQQLTPEEWDKQAVINKRMLPKYGYLPKSEDEKKADQDFVKTILEKDSTNRKGSDHLINLGFNYISRGDLKTAMYRFNQAYLIDSTNSDIYWGFGGVYLTLGKYEDAKNQYIKGLSIDPKNPHLLTDYATYYMAQYYGIQPIDEKGAMAYLDSAIIYMRKSYSLDSKDQSTVFKLSVCYWLKGECVNAWKYHDECKILGGQPITEEYTQDLKIKCKQK